MRLSHASAVALALLVAAEACSSDLFHGTDWSSRCDRDPDWSGCESPVTVSSTVGGGGDGGVGGQGAVTTGNGGGGGVGGGTGGAGGGGGVDCSICNELLTSATPLIVPTGPYCTPASEAAHAALRSCACQVSCIVECTNECAGGATAPTCTNCVTTNCVPQLMDCNAN